MTVTPNTFVDNPLPALPRSDAEQSPNKLDSSQSANSSSAQQPEGRSATRSSPQHVSEKPPLDSERAPTKSQLDAHADTQKQRPPQATPIPTDRHDDMRSDTSSPYSDTTSDSHSPDEKGYVNIRVPDDPKERGPKGEIRQTKREDDSSAREQPSIHKGLTPTTSSRPTRLSLLSIAVIRRGTGVDQPFTRRPPNSQSVSGHLPEEQRETSEIRQSGQGSGHGQGVSRTNMPYMPGDPSLPPKDQHDDTRSGTSNPHSDTASDSHSPDDKGYGNMGVPDNTKERGTKEDIRQMKREDDSSAREQPSIPKGPSSTAGDRPTHHSLYSQAAIRRGTAVYQPSTRRPPNSQSISGHPPEEQRETSEIRQSAQGSGYGQGVMKTIMSYMPGEPSPPNDKYQVLKERFHQVQIDRDNHALELQRSQGELRDANHHINQLLRDKQRSNDQINGLQIELNNIYQQLEDAKALSEARGKELVGAQVFLTKADTLSISEVGEKVTALNEEIFQAAATLGETIIHKRHEFESQGDFDAACKESRSMIGSKITDLLVNRPQKQESEIDLLLVQVVLQIFMVKFCVRKIQSWYPSDRTLENFLSEIYSDICSTEEQAVSGRWRAITRAHTRLSTDSWTKELDKKLFSILTVAAWGPNYPDSQELFIRRLPPIFKAVSELRIALGEKFTSADLDVSVFDCDTPYDSSVMDDAYGDHRHPSGKQALGTVVGTTGIGLKVRIKGVPGAPGSHFQNVISAKVVLESTLNETLKSVQPLGKRREKRKYTNGANQDGRD